jgi:hypothetical protein
VARTTNGADMKVTRSAPVRGLGAHPKPMPSQGALAEPCRQDEASSVTIAAR